MLSMLGKIQQAMASMAQLETRPAGDQEVAGRPPPGQQHSFVEI